MRRAAWLYPVLIGSSILTIAAVLQLGTDWLASNVAIPSAGVQAAPAPQSLWDVWRTNLTQPLARLLLQIFLIIAAARIFGYAARQVGQPSVMVGMALRPSNLMRANHGLVFAVETAILRPA